MVASASPYSPEAMRARFHELTAEQKAAQEQMDALKKERDDLVAEYEPKLRALRQQIVEFGETSGLYERGQEIATIARALGGKTGKPPGEDDTEGDEAEETAAE